MMMKKILILTLSLFFLGDCSAASLSSLDQNLVGHIPFVYVIDLSPIDDTSVLISPLYKVGTILASYVYPRAHGFASFEKGSCTDFAAQQRPDLFLNADGTRRITGNADQWLLKAKSLGIPTGSIPQVGAIAVYYEGRGARQYGHVAYIQSIQSDGNIVVAEMNYQEDYVVTIRVVDAALAAGYIY